MSGYPLMPNSYPENPLAAAFPYAGPGLAPTNNQTIPPTALPEPVSGHSLKHASMTTEMSFFVLSFCHLPNPKHSTLRRLILR